MRHLIQRQTIEITAPEAGLAKDSHQRLHTLFKTHALPVMDEVFTRFSSPRQFTRLEKIELDLGTLSSDALEHDFVPALRNALEKALQQRLSEGGRQATTAGEAGPGSSHQSALETVIYFLHHGVLPWWATLDDAAELEALALGLLKQDTAEVIQQLRKAASQTVLERLIKQFGEAFYPALYKKLLANLESPLSEMVRQWSLLAEDTALDDAVKLDINVLLLRALLRKDVVHLQPERLSEHILRRLRSEARDKTKLPRLLVTQTQRALSKKSPLYRWLSIQAQTSTNAPVKDKAPLKPFWSTSGKEAQSDQTAAVEKPITQALPTERTGVVALQAEGGVAATDESTEAVFAEDPRRVMQTEAKEAEWLNLGSSYYILNAGLVLLWPFLERFFRSLELSERGRFVSKAAQHKAVSILHYLSNGENGAHEHALLLNKLLCGWPLQQPLWRKDELTERDKAEADELLSAVIDHWKVLKNTSVDGLRQGFLQREGRLSQQNDSWELKIARSGYDVLLDQLPWGISTIHLPWMREVVFVEW